MKDAHEKLKSGAPVLSAALGSAAAAVIASVAAEPVTAIDILLEPDATMLGRAFAANQRLRDNYPEGFALDATHQPHVTILHRFVRTRDLEKVHAAVGEVLAAKKPVDWKLKACKFYYSLWEGLGIAGIAIEPTDDLIGFQQKLIDAVAPFAVEAGSAAAFATTQEEPEINQATVDYVATFVPTQVGQNFNPHVTVGLAHEDFLKTVLDERFEDFTFSAVGLAVYQLGNFGTAQKKLRSWTLQP
jgi:2'-5' RNA ligase